MTLGEQEGKCWHDDKCFVFLLLSDWLSEVCSSLMLEAAYSYCDVLTTDTLIRHEMCLILIEQKHKLQRESQLKYIA